jgi:hypothetical protein
MGTDIHYVVEKNTELLDCRWIGLFTERPWSPDKLACQRNYSVFGRLAMVRAQPEGGHPPRGIPDDVSDLAGYLLERREGASHSHSWLTLAEFRRAFIDGYRDQAKSLEDRKPVWADELRVAADKIGGSECYDVLFGTGTVPMKAETGLDEDGEEFYRVVFWFYN